MPTPHRTGTPQVRHVITGSPARHGLAIAETDIRVSLASGFWMVLAVARRANLRRVRSRYSGVTPSCPGEDLPGLIGPAARAVARQAHSARSRRIGHTRPTPPPHATHTARVAPWGGSGAGVPGPGARGPGRPSYSSTTIRAARTKGSCVSRRRVSSATWPASTSGHARTRSKGVCGGSYRRRS